MAVSAIANETRRLTHVCSVVVIRSDDCITRRDVQVLVGGVGVAAGVGAGSRSGGDGANEGDGNGGKGDRELHCGGDEEREVEGFELR